MSHFWSKTHCNLEFIKKKLKHGEIVHNFIFKINEATNFECPCIQSWMQPAYLEFASEALG